MKTVRLLSTLCMGMLFVAGNLAAIDPNDTRLLEQPAISQDHIAFIYAHVIGLTVGR